MNLLEIIKKKNDDNKLNLDVNHVYSMCLKHEHENKSYKVQEVFYIYLLKYMEQEIAKVSSYKVNNKFLSVKTQVSDKKIVSYYVFRKESDYKLWLKNRHLIYNELNEKNIRILNFIELSTFNFISDTKSNCTYKLNKRVFFKLFNKTIIIKKNNLYLYNTNKKFIKYLVSKFKNNYNFIPK